MPNNHSPSGLQATAPKYQLSWNAEQSFPIGSASDGYVGVSGTYRSGTAAQFGVTSTALTQSLFSIPAYATLDMRAGVRLNDGKTYVEVWGRNVTDKFYVTNILAASDVIVRLPGAPATYGVRIGSKF
jgi:iron complex outermembrane recepter protein